MFRSFWPTTAYGMFAFRLCLLVIAVFVLWGVVPMLAQSLIHVSLEEGIPGVVAEPEWFLRWVQPTLTVGLLGLAIASGVLAMVAKWRYGDTGRALWIAMVPFVLIVVFFIGELTPPYH
jgi:hypothetical protein